MVEVVILVVWFAAFPPTVELERVPTTVWQANWVCKYGEELVFTVILIAYHALILIYGIFLVFQVRLV